ncbi:hypothetical protein FIBSPDRAFT_931581 [Athelia psychrophila]|uniref:PAS domain-containing protein n=1 Tax=Athelia psychrophila TaxID=1759441 RepID=A0A166K5M7_9AGAM|nr:hypothetical protein FIBSPDRAFT_931581 [Fibularhizoctonia sp. CBS 109695]
MGNTPICYWALLRITAGQQELQFVTIDPNFELQLGHDAHEILGRNLFDFVQPGRGPEQQQGSMRILAQRFKAQRDAGDSHMNLTPIRVKYARIDRIRDNIEGNTSRSATQAWIPMDLRIDFLFRGLALCFLHKAILRDEDCQFPPLDDAQFGVMSARIGAALGMPEEPFPKYLFQIVNADLGKGLIWPRDTHERDDAPCLLEVFKRVPPTAHGCRVVHVVEDNWLKVGLCRSEVIRYGNIFFARHFKLQDIRETTAIVEDWLSLVPPQPHM